jgi:hypothetical protein
MIAALRYFNTLYQHLDREFAAKQSGVSAPCLHCRCPAFGSTNQEARRCAALAARERIVSRNRVVGHTSLFVTPRVLGNLPKPAPLVACARTCSAGAAALTLTKINDLLLGGLYQRAFQDGIN